MRLRQLNAPRLMVERLIRRGGDVHAATVDGRTPIMSAAITVGLRSLSLDSQAKVHLSVAQRLLGPQSLVLPSRKSKDVSTSKRF
jgi:hypothetical protein